MKFPIRFLVPTIAFAVLVAFFGISLQRDPGRIPSPLIGKPAPPFSLESLAGPAWKVSSADFSGRPWLLNVWATWCAECRDEHGTLLAIARENRVPIIGLNWNDDRALALRWLEQLGNPYVSVAYDPEGRTAIDWGVYGAPETFLIDSGGRLIKKHVGTLTMETWQREFLPLLQSAEGGR